MAIEAEDIAKLLKNQHNIAGKDYFTVNEAAFYCCVSVSKFYEKATEYGLLSFKFMGKIVYKKTDLQRVIENEAQKQWQLLRNERTPGAGNSRGKSQRLAARRGKSENH